MGFNCLNTRILQQISNMKNLVRFNTIILAVLLSFTAIQFMSCDDDEEKDPEPVVLDREAFIGSYIGEFTCPGLLAFVSSDSLAFSIDPGVDPADESGIILNLSIDGNAVAFAGSVTGDSLTVMDMLENVTIEIAQLGGSVTGDVTGIGSATIDMNMIDGTITLTLEVPSLGGHGPITEICDLVGIKQ